MRRTNGLVVSTGKAYVDGIGHEVDIGITGLQLLYGMVGRAVVNDIDFAIDAVEGSLHALQALVEQAADIIADDYDCDFLVHAKGMQISRMTAM